MSFFQEEGDDSNLQYDDAAFMYFIASTLIVATATIFVFVLRDLLSLRISDRSTIERTGRLNKQLVNLAALKRRKVFTLRFFLKIAVIGALVGLTIGVFEQSRRAENKMKGFDPYEILGLSRSATLRDVKKAYRKLALQFHPDKNIGNPDAQAKFILISKSYECFTDQTKKANCFKYGNPDGAGSFRVGIGLPKIFIEVEYKWYVLPIVLSIFLLIIPAFIIRWNNKNITTDNNGISIESYRMLFRCLEGPISKYTTICLLASYKEISEDLEYGPISKENKQLLREELNKHPQAVLPIFGEFNDNQLNIYWEIYKYSAGIADFTRPQFAEVVEKYLDVTYQIAKPFAMRGNDGVVLSNNPDFTIRFIGTSVLENVCAFSRDYYNRSLHKPITNFWTNYLDLTEEEIKIAEANPIDNIYLTLKQNRVDQYVQIFPEGRRQYIKTQLEGLPIYDLESKLLIDGKQVDRITNLDYAEIKYKLSRRGKGNGYCVLSQYPYPKLETLYLLVIAEKNLIHFQKVEFKNNKDYFIGKMSIRSERVGVVLPLQFFFVSSTYIGLDIFTPFNLPVVEPTHEQINRRIEFHPEDINLEKIQKSAFEQLMELELDPEENELSDSEEEEELKPEQRA